VLYIEKKVILPRVIEALIAEARAREDDNGDITVDSERGYDPDAKRFNVHSKWKSDDELIDAIIAECDEYDEVHIFVGGSHDEGYGPYVYLIFGNGNCGWDVLSDYSGALEKRLEPVMEFILSEGAIS
jgi:hypothetical protein